MMVSTCTATVSVAGSSTDVSPRALQKGNSTKIITCAFGTASTPTPELSSHGRVFMNQPGHPCSSGTGLG